MKYSTVFWDFNGTIADDIALSINSVNKMLKKRNLPLIKSVEQYHSIFCFPVKEYYRAVGFDFSKESFETLAIEWVKNYTENESELSLTNGFLEVWRYLSERNVRQIVLSSSESEMLYRQLAHLGLNGKFDQVHGSDNIYAGGKIEMAKRYTGTENKHAVLIGDTLHDAETARAIGADCILYTGGHGSTEKLLSLGFPTVSSLAELIGFFD